MFRSLAKLCRSSNAAFPACSRLLSSLPGASLASPEPLPRPSPAAAAEDEPPPEIEPDHVAQVKDMVHTFLTSFSSREDRLAFLVDQFFPFTRKHYLRSWELESAQPLYDVLQFELLFCSTDQILSLLKVCSAKAPLARSILEVLYNKDKDIDLDFTTCLALCRTSVEHKLPNHINPELYFSSLREKLLSHVSGFLDGSELAKALKVLRRGQYFSEDMAEHVAEYLSRHLHQFDVEHASLNSLQLGLTRHLSKTRDAPFFEAVNSYCLKFVHDIMRFDKVEDRARHLGNSYGYHLGGFLLLFHKTSAYCEVVCEALAELLMGPMDKQIHFPTFMCKMVTTSSVLGYYNGDLFERIIQLSLSQLESFTFNQLSYMLRAFVRLNHAHPQFLSEVTRHVLQSHQEGDSLDVYWSIMNSSVYMNSYNSEVLEKFLTNEMMKTSLDQKVFHSSTLLNLLTGLAVENPSLGHGTVTDLRFGSLPYHFTTLSNDYVLLALSFLVGIYRKKRFSIFASNFSRALKAAVGSGHFRTEPLTLCGYGVDFEVLFGEDGGTVPVPFNWKHVRPESVLKSIGVRASVLESFPVRRSDMSELLMELKRSDSDDNATHKPSSVPVATRGGDADDKSSSAPLGSEDWPNVVRAYGIHLASDWGRYFVRPEHMPRLVRRVAVELNGPMHYAVNTRGHVKGKDVVKRRQLEALGWEVIEVPYYEWHQLRTGDDQIQYIKEKLYRM